MYVTFLRNHTAHFIKKINSIKILKNVNFIMSKVQILSEKCLT